jgi:hypothetical protein
VWIFIAVVWYENEGRRVGTVIPSKVTTDDISPADIPFSGIY